MTNDCSFSHLPDNALITEAKRLASRECHATAQLVGALAEIDGRQLYLSEGCSSLFTYCTQVLHLAEGSAYNRIEAARAVRRFPAILTALEAGEVTLTAVRLLAPHLTAENLDSTLAAARHRCKREVEMLVVALRPLAAAPTIIRRLPTPSCPASQAAPKGPVPATVSGDAALSVPATPPSTRSTGSLATSVTALAPERFKLQFTVSRETHDKLRQAQDLLRHVVPSGDPAEIFDRALTLLLQHVQRQKLAVVTQPRRGTATRTDSRYIPAHVRREVWKRDCGRCAFMGREGRCRETAFLELHHVEPFAEGGKATVQNIQLRCRAHNQFESRLYVDEHLFAPT